AQASQVTLRETQPTFTKLTSQKPVLFDQVRNCLSLPAVRPAGQHTEHQVQRRGVDHEPELTSWLPRRISADLWNPTGFSVSERDDASGKELQERAALAFPRDRQAIRRGRCDRHRVAGQPSNRSSSRMLYFTPKFVSPIPNSRSGVVVAVLKMVIKVCVSADAKKKTLKPSTLLRLLVDDLRVDLHAKRD